MRVTFSDMTDFKLSLIRFLKILLAGIVSLFLRLKFNHTEIARQNFSAVFISHFHDDHCSLESLNYLNRATPIYLYCLNDELFEMIRKLGFKNVTPLKLNGSIQVGPFEVIPAKL